MSFAPANHYWERQDGNIYSSAQQADITTDNAEYKAWLTNGNFPSQFPRNLEGQNDEQELSDILSRYGLRMYPETIDEAKATKLAEIVAAANTMSAAIKAKYSQPEIDSWQQQEAEARALLADTNALAPLVRKLAANAGVDADEFALRIVGNSEAAAAATEAIILQQQAMEKIAKEAESTENVKAIEVSYVLA